MQSVLKTSFRKAFETLLILDDIIKGRKEFSQWYSQSSRKDSGTRDKNNSHFYFIQALLEVHQYLRSAYQTNGKVNARKSEVCPPSLVNIYQALAIEEPLSNPRAKKLTESERKTCASRTSVQIQVDLETDSTSEKDFEIFCFLRQCYDLRSFAKETWQSYYTGDVSVMVASTVSQSVLWLIHDATEDFKEKNPDLSRFEDLTEHLGLVSITSDGKLEHFACRHNEHWESDTEGSLAASALLCMPAFTTMSLYQSAFKTGPLSSDHTLDTWNHILAGHPMSKRLVYLRRTQNHLQ